MGVVVVVVTLHVVVVAAGWSAGNSRRGVLVPEGDRQKPGGEVDSTARWASQVPETGLPREGQLQRATLRRTCGLCV